MPTRSLTYKQRLFISNYLENGGNGTQAALGAYRTLNLETAHSIASENLRKPAVMRAIEAAVEKAGLTDDQIASKLAKAINSGLGKKATNADSLRGLEMVSKMKDHFPAARNVNTNLNAEISKLENTSVEELKEIALAKANEIQSLISRLP